MTRAIAIAAASFALVTAAAAESRATPSAKLTYLRGPGAERCPDEAELKKAVAARLGYDVFFPWAKTTVVAEIAREKKGFSGKVKVVDEHALVRGERAIASTSEDCADVVRALALAISIAVDDFTIDDVPALPASTPPEPAPSPESPTAERASETREAIEKDRTPTAKPVPNLAGSLWLAPMLSWGIAPAAAVGLELGGAAHFRSLSLGLEARADLPASTSLSPAGRVRTELFAGSLVPCIHAPAPFAVCALITAGAFRESGSGLAQSRSGTAAFGGAGPRVAIEIPFAKRFFFLAHADGLFTFSRHVVVVDGAPVFTIAPATASLGLGAGVKF